MNKQVYIDKIAIITDELQQITSLWLQKDYAISPIEVENYLSNIRYLSEQAEILRKYLHEIEGTKIAETKNAETKNENTKNENSIAQNLSEEIQKPVESTQSFSAAEKLHVEMSDIPSKTTELPDQKEEYTLHQKLSAQMNDNSLADVLKHDYFHKELSFSLNEKFYIVQNLFNGDEKDFNKVMAHLATLDSWEEIEFYLNATCKVPYEWESKQEHQIKFYEMLMDRIN